MTSETGLISLILTFLFSFQDQFVSAKEQQNFQTDNTGYVQKFYLTHTLQLDVLASQLSCFCTVCLFPYFRLFERQKHTYRKNRHWCSTHRFIPQMPVAAKAGWLKSGAFTNKTQATMLDFVTVRYEQFLKDIHTLIPETWNMLPHLAKGLCKYNNSWPLKGKRFYITHLAQTQAESFIPPRPDCFGGVVELNAL